MDVPEDRYETPPGWRWEMFWAWHPVRVNSPFPWRWLVNVWRRKGGNRFEYLPAVRKPETDEEFERRQW